MNICIISGSARANNNTIRVSRAIEKLYERHVIKLIDFQQYDIPLLAQGNIQHEALTHFQQQLTDAMHNADIIYIITPEYNWSTTPEILNWLHRFGDRNYKHLFNEKVFVLIGVSTGKGGKAPALHLTGILNKIISFLDLESVVSPKIFESHFTKETLDEDGNSLGSPEYDKGLKELVAYTNRIAQRWFK